MTASPRPWSPLRAPLAVFAAVIVLSLVDQAGCEYGGNQQPRRELRPPGVSIDPR